jgi:hypothetical protein
MLALVKEPWMLLHSPTVLAGLGMAHGSPEESVALFGGLKRPGEAVKESLHLGMTLALAENAKGEKRHFRHRYLLGFFLLRL